MLSPKLKADIRHLWDRFWSGGIANPLTAIEQITYLVFLKRLEDLDNQRMREALQANRPYQSIYDIPEGETFRWSYIKRLSGQDQLSHVQGPVFNWLRSRHDAGDRMRDAVFVIGSPNLLAGAIEIIDGLFVPAHNQDTLGDIYELLLSEIAEAGKNGQFRTPRHIIRAMCDLVDPRYDERICDPACGTGGFLVNAYQHILKSNTSEGILSFQPDGTPLHLYGDQLTTEQHQKLRENHFYGYDFDRTMVRLGWMNMIQHGMINPQINYADTLGSAFNNDLRGGDNDGTIGEFDVVLANPPFTGSIDKDDIGKSLKHLDSNKTELLFVELILQLLRVGGRAGVIVPEGFLFGSTRAHRNLRSKLVTENQLNAVISLPGGVFQPYTGVKTSILLLARGGSTEQVWFYEVSADGFALNAKRTELPESNDLWDMVLKYRLHFAPSFPQPIPAFIDGDTWRQWHSMDQKIRSINYLQPVFRQSREIIEGESVGVQELDSFETQTTSNTKDWQVTQSEIAENNDNLTAGRYKPMSLATAKHDSPAKIIRDLQDLENKIQVGLAKLLTMVESQE